MQRRQIRPRGGTQRAITTLTLGGALATGVLASPAQAAPGELDLDHVHHMPDAYLDPWIAVPPASGQQPDYPLAAAFTPADASNYTAGGINSYDYVVVHTMQGYYGGSISWFQNPMSNVSAHYCMRAEDGEVTQMVRNTDRAWHVGSNNASALGIEHEGFIDDASWYTWQTYLSSARLARWLCDEYEIPVDRDHIVGHVELPNQTHTDPGANWNWDLYMALVRDVVPQAQVQGVVVDQGAACVLETAADTWLKTTVQPADDVEAANKCFVAAGTPLTIQHMSGEIHGNVRVTMPADGLCPGGLDTEAFVDSGALAGTCPPGVVAVEGAEVTLGEQTTTTDNEGRFVFSDIAQGEHLVEVDAAGYEPDGVMIAVDVYPGARVVVPVVASEGSDGGADGDDGDEGDPDDGSTSDPADDDAPDGDGEDPDDGAAGTADGTGGTPTDPGILPDTFGGSTTSDGGCGCTATPTGPRSVAAWMLLGLAIGAARRRRP